MMMSSTFSIFDPSMYMLSSAWITLLLIMFMIFPTYWSNSFVKVLYSLLMDLMVKEISSNTNKNQKGVYKMIISILVIIFMLNIMSIFPYVFSVTCHMAFNMPLSFTMWMSILIFSFTKFTKKFMSHLTPTGTPLPLVSFMVIIELLSNMIRPISLTFRLTANMIAGHILMSLVSKFILSAKFISSLMMVLFLQSMMVGMEMAVAFIQAYVFSVLLLLYLSE